ncbi:MAG: hypothetical protein K9K79_08140 [Desulfohalobiaceae bacterium]|nr:hypothetical protein [Desulfohalobiaceae bacterium]
MKLKCKSVSHLLQLYRFDFLGQQGFLVPGGQPFSPGKRIELHISVGDEYVGSARTTMIWQNLTHKSPELLPRGTFLKLLDCDRNLMQLLNP